MDALQLSQEMQAAVAQEFPDAPEGTEQFPSKYFNYGVKVIAPDGTPTPVSPRECSTNFGAGCLGNVLTHSRKLPCYAVLRDWQGTKPQGGWNDSEPVPFLRFAKYGDDFTNGPFTGPEINAGLMLEYFNHGWPAPRALNSCELEVIDAFLKAGDVKLPDGRVPSEIDTDAIMLQTGV